MSEIKYNCFPISVIGNKEKNQDAVAVDPSFRFFVIADGISSQPRSEEGSQQAVEAAIKVLKEFQPGSEPSEFVARAMGESNKAVYLLNLIKDDQGMQRVSKLAGTTLDIGLIHEDCLYIAHIGDGRVYVVNEDNSLELITRDHSCDGALEKYLGLSENISEYDTSIKPLDCNKAIFVATDGIHKNLSDEELKGFLCQDAPLDAIMNQIIARAQKPEYAAKAFSQKYNVPFEYAQRKLGGNDNMTGIIISLRRETK